MGTEKLDHTLEQVDIKQTRSNNKLFYSFRPKLNKIGLDL